jgi:predicted N-acetyltransferase YhbS
MPTNEAHLTPELVLRTVRDERDIERFAAFHTAINDAVQGETCANLLRHHPDITDDDFLLIEDKSRGDIVSTVCLIPWQHRCEEVTLRVAMLEMVATHPNYRQRGLVRALIKRFHQIVSERHFDFIIIEGIPYYYRQFGYAYAMDHGRMDSLPVWRIPDLPASATERYQRRPATLDDLPTLTQLYQRAIAPLQWATLRPPAYWRYLLQAANYPVQMVEDRQTGEVTGYLCAIQQPIAGRTRVFESSLADAATALSVLRQLKQETANELQLGWPLTNTLLQVGRSLGSTPMAGDQWLLRIPDVAALLSKLAPVLERRLAASSWAGLTATLLINLFRQAFALRFIDGKLYEISRAGFVDASMGADGGDLCIPPDAFVRLIFGYRTLDELQDGWPDIVVRPASRHLLDSLFVKAPGYFWMPYLTFVEKG